MTGVPLCIGLHVWLSSLTVLHGVEALATVLVLTSVWLTVSKWYWWGFLFSAFSCIVWGYVALESSLYGLLFVEVAITAMNVRGLLTHQINRATDYKIGGTD